MQDSSNLKILKLVCFRAFDDEPEDSHHSTHAANLHFPGLHYEAADWLVTQRRVKLVGIDTPSIDYGQSRTFMAHVLLFRANVPAPVRVLYLLLLKRRYDAAMRELYPDRPVPAMV